MRDIHKWKDKVEFSLDTRQVFFLFFGLSIAGCVIFVLGLMTGRSTSWQPNLMALSDPSHAGFPTAIHASVSESDLDLDLGLGTESREVAEQESINTTQKNSKTSKKRQADEPESKSRGRATRTPPERDVRKSVDRFKVARGKGSHSPKTVASKKQPTPKKRRLGAEKPLVASISSKPAPRPQKTAQAKSSAKSIQSSKTRQPRTFTLMLKSFAEIEDAQRLVDQLKSNGHAVRLESYESRGRTWHRVLLGNFDQWDDGLKAKSKFEKAEHLIAWLIVKPQS